VPRLSDTTTVQLRTPSHSREGCRIAVSRTACLLALQMSDEADVDDAKDASEGDDEPTPKQKVGKRTVDTLDSSSDDEDAGDNTRAEPAAAKQKTPRSGTVPTSLVRSPLCTCRTPQAPYVPVPCVWFGAGLS
jgi:hypothetical protein